MQSIQAYATGPQVSHRGAYLYLGLLDYFFLIFVTSMQVSVGSVSIISRQSQSYVMMNMIKQ
jgi:hypothetical protein